MRDRKKIKKRDIRKVVMIFLGSMGGGALLIFTAWWPIQSQRALTHLHKIERNLSIKKSEFHRLQQRFEQLTSLATIDQWAKANGPWRGPQPNDVITIQSQ